MLSDCDTLPEIYAILTAFLTPDPGIWKLGDLVLTVIWTEKILTELFIKFSQTTIVKLQSEFTKTGTKS